MSDGTNWFAQEVVSHFDIDKYREVINEHVQKGNVKETAKIVKLMCLHTAPSSEDWIGWIDGLKMVDGEFIEAMKNTCFSTKVFKKYCEIVEDKNEYEEIYKKFKYFVQESQQFWQLHVNYLLENNVTNDEILKCFDDRIATPHLQIDDTFIQYSTWTRKNLSEKGYENRMKKASKTVENTKKLINYRQPYEKKLKTSNSLENYQEYLSMEQKRPSAKQDHVQIMTLYERALTDYQRNVDLWEDYLLWVSSVVRNDKVGSVDINKNTIFFRALVNCPFSDIIWYYCIINADILSEDDESTSEFEILVEKAQGCDLIVGTEKWNNVARALFIVYQREGLDLSDISQEVQVNENTDFEMVLTIMSVYEKDDDNKKLGLEKCKEFVKFFKHEPRFWEKLIRLVNDNSQKSKLWHEALSNTNIMEYPDDLIKEFVHYSEVNSERDDHLRNLNKAHRKLKQTASRHAAGYAAAAAAADPYEPHNNPLKRTVADEQETTGEKPKKKIKTRDREHCEVLVSNLNETTTTEEDISKLFSDCGEIVKITLNENTASVEFKDRDDVLAALTKDNKQLNSSIIHVTTGENTTLWVTNFPPSYTPESIRNLFSQYGKLLDVRFPRQNTKSTSRRFCYVQFENKVQALEAVRHLNSSVTDGFTLVVKISDPSKRTERTDDSELHIKSIDFKVDEDQLRGLFSTYGTINKIKLPNNHKGKGKLNDGYAFITMDSSSEVKSCIENLNGYELNGRKLSVESSHKNKEKKEEKKYIQLDNDRTVNVYNVDNIVSKDQLVALFGEYGLVTNVLLEPWKKAARVEFEGPASVGKAALALEGRELAGLNLQFTPPVSTEASKIFTPRAVRKK